MSGRLKPKELFSVVSNCREGVSKGPVCTKRIVLKSMGYFERAIQGDASYAPVYAGLANSYLLSAGWLLMRPAEAYPKAMTAALHALELNENLAEAHTTLAEAEHEYEWKWADAEREFRRAIELDPNSAIAHKSYAEFLMHGGRSAEVISEMERARDPLSLIVNTFVGFVYHNARQHNGRLKSMKRCYSSILSSHRHIISWAGR